MMKKRDALRGGMPLYKYLGNRILTTAQNWLLGSDLSEFHSGYRVYSAAALAKIPFDRNTNQFHFDTEIIIQLIRAGMRIKELPIPTYYGDEICRVDGLKYAKDVMRATLLSRVQDLGILYQRKFDVDAAPRTNRSWSTTAPTLRQLSGCEAVGSSGGSKGPAEKPTFCRSRQRNAFSVIGAIRFEGDFFDGSPKQLADFGFISWAEIHSAEELHSLNRTILRSLKRQNLPRTDVLRPDIFQNDCHRPAVLA